MFGRFYLNPTAASAFYGGIVRLRIGGEGSSYLVDGNGRAIHHTDSDHIGADFSDQPVVELLSEGRVGAVRTRDVNGEDIVAGFAQVPGTPWGLVTEESWSSLISDSGDKQRFLLLLLALGVALPAIFVFIGLKRIMRPVEHLIAAAREVASGNFSQTIAVRSGDEIGVLAQQFNTMAGALKESYADLERKVEARTEDLARSNSDLQQFAYVASHDLQEPLRMVASYTQLLGRRYKGRLDSDADEFIAYAVDGATRMRDLIDDLLAYSRVETHTKGFAPTDCNAVFDEAVDNLRTAIDDSQATVTHDTLPTVRADKSQLVELFQNLISNAIKFHGEEPPRIHVSAGLQENGRVFSVRDNGIGIDSEYADRIFGIFQRLHTRDQYPGTGIGLAICKRVVESHGGQI